MQGYSPLSLLDLVIVNMKLLGKNVSKTCLINSDYV